MFQYFAADFDYTLRAIPNHHRALVSMARYSEKVKNPKPPGAGRTVDCYFDRAIRFAPDDHIVRMIWAGYLTRNRRIPEAMVQLDFVAGLAGESALTHHNLALSYFDAGAYDQSLREAHIAFAQGMTRPDAKEKLIKAGKWREPAVGDGAASAPAATLAPATAASPVASAAAQ